MKKKKIVSVIITALGFVLFAVSCDREHDEYGIQSVDPIKIDSVKIAQTTMDVFTIQTIKTYSTYPSGCYGFYGYEYLKDGLTRKVTAYSYQLNGVCAQTPRVGTSAINFRPEEKGTYTFKFWKGKDSSNQDVWIEKTVVVQ